MVPDVWLFFCFKEIMEFARFQAPENMYFFSHKKINITKPKISILCNMVCMYVTHSEFWFLFAKQHKCYFAPAYPP